MMKEVAQIIRKTIMTAEFINVSIVDI